MNATRQIGGLSLDRALAQLQPWSERAPAIADDEYQQRLERARELMREQRVDALLITAGSTLRYFSGIPWPASERLVAMLLTMRGEPVVIAPAFETGSLTRVLRIHAAIRVWEEHEDPYAHVLAAATQRHVGSLALDPSAPYHVFTRLHAALGSKPIVDAGAIVDGCRMRKSDAELALMKQATAMTLQVHRLAAGLIREGIRKSELVHFIDTAHRAMGADNGSTFCIVQFGNATAYPHGIPGDQQLATDELVLIDTGCSVQGYNSDITRTYIFGTPSDDQQRIWDLERAAQQAAFEAARCGIYCEDVDAAARGTVVRAGLGPEYRVPGIPHRTGHGCGLDIHESPYLVRGDRTRLAPGMCCSNEPMIVVPDRFGVRLEDHFYVTEDGPAWFTPPAPAIDQPFA